MFTTRLLSAASCAPGGDPARDLLLALSILFPATPDGAPFVPFPPPPSLRARIHHRHASSSPFEIGTRIRFPLFDHETRISKGGKNRLRKGTRRNREGEVDAMVGAFHEGELFPRSEARNRILTSRDGRAFEELGELISERGAITGLRVASWEEKLAEEGEVEGESGGDRRGVVTCPRASPRPRARPRFVTARILPRAPRKNLHANSVANPGQRARSPTPPPAAISFAVSRS